jgi:uncharacterized protein YycO
MLKYAKYFVSMAIVIILVLCTNTVVFAADPKIDDSIINKDLLTAQDWKYIDSLSLEQKQSLLTERFQNIKQEPTLRELAAINNMTENEFAAFMKQQQESAEYLSKNGAAMLAQDQQEMADLYLQDPEAAKIKYYKMFSENSEMSNSTTMQILAGGSVGTYGDILVTHGINSSVGLTGHAGIVSQWSTNTIESWPQINSPFGLEGVQWYPNNWGSYANTYGLGVTGATSSEYSNAAIYAQNQVGKPFNWIFGNKYLTSSYYCSQLVWRSWLEQGYNVDFAPWDTIVLPDELVWDGNTYTFYSN